MCNTVETTNMVSQVSIDTIFAAFITILVFVLGFGIKWLFLFINENRKLKELKSFLLYSADSYIKDVKKQITNVENLSEEISSLHSVNYSFTKVHGIRIDYTSDISKIDIYRIFVTRKKGSSDEKYSNYSLIRNSPNYFLNQENISIKNYEEFLISIKKYKKQWLENGNELFKIFDIMVQEHISSGKSKSDDKFLTLIDSILYEWQNIKENQSYVVIKETIIDPIKNTCKDFRSDHRINLLFPIIRNLNNSYLNIISVTELYSSIFSKQVENLIINISKLEKAIEYYE